MKGSNFVFDSIEGLHCSGNNISLNYGGSKISCQKQLKSKKGTIDSKTNDNIYFKYVVIAALHHKKQEY